MEGLSCSSNKMPEKPKITMQEYKRQETIVLEVIVKLFGLESSEMVHAQALALQRARVIQCIPVAKECELYHLLLNRIIQFSSDNINKEEEQKLRELAKELRASFHDGVKQLDKQWSHFQTFQNKNP